MIWYLRNGGTITLKFVTVSGVHVISLPRKFESSINFPDWVGEPTPCKTRTFSVVVRKAPHGAIRIEKTFPNRPLHLARGKNGELYMKWGEK